MIGGAAGNDLRVCNSWFCNLFQYFWHHTHIFLPVIFGFINCQNNLEGWIVLPLLYLLLITKISGCAGAIEDRKILIIVTVINTILD